MTILQTCWTRTSFGHGESWGGPLDMVCVKVKEEGQTRLDFEHYFLKSVGVKSDFIYNCN